MKAIGYELRQRAIRADHCDTPITVTGVTVVPERREMPQKLISSGFEHCDSKKWRSNCHSCFGGSLISWLVLN